MKHITVSDHALVRYLERVKSMDFDAVRDEICELVAPTVAAGGSACSINGHVFALDGAVVTTVTLGRTPAGSRVQGRRKNGLSVRVRQ